MRNDLDQCLQVVLLFVNLILFIFVFVFLNECFLSIVFYVGITCVTTKVGLSRKTILPRKRFSSVKSLWRRICLSSVKTLFVDEFEFVNEGLVGKSIIFSGNIFVTYFVGKLSSTGHLPMKVLST